METNDNVNKVKVNRTKNSITGTIFGFISKAITILFPFVLRTVILKVLGEEYLGLSSLFTSILTVLNIVELGFGSALVFNMYRPIAENNKKEICALLNIYKRIYRIFGLIVFGIGLCIMPFLKYLINGSYPQDINLYFLFAIYLLQTVSSYYFFSYKKSLLEAHQRVDIIARWTSLINLLQYTYQIIILFVLKNYYAYICITPFISISTNLVLAFITKKMYPEYIASGTIEVETKKSMIKCVKGLFIGKISGVTRNALDSVVLSIFFGLVTVTIYNNYFYIISSLTAILAVIHNAIQAGVGNSIVSESVEKNYADFKKFNYIYMWICAVFTVCLFNLYQPFMKIWVGDTLMLTESSVILFTIYFYITKTGDILSVYNGAAGLWWETRIASIVEVILNISLNILLGKFLGINGIILATIISLFVTNFLINNFVTYKYYFKDNTIKDYFKFNFIYSLVTLLLCVGSYYICHFIPFDGIILLIVEGLFCFGFAFLLFPLFTCWYKESKPAFEFLKKRILKRE